MEIYRNIQGLNEALSENLNCSDMQLLTESVLFSFYEISEELTDKLKQIPSNCVWEFRFLYPMN